MSNIKTSLFTTAAATLFLVGSAWATTALAGPAAGNAPYFDGAVASSSTLQRSDVEAQAAAHLPAAGEFSGQANASQAPSTLTRAQVEATVDRMPAAGESA